VQLKLGYQTEKREFAQEKGGMHREKRKGCTAQYEVEVNKKYQI
jgi:hypothetical protein